MINGVNYTQLFLPRFSPFPRMGLFAGPRKLNTKLSNHREMKEICRCALSAIKEPAATCCLFPGARGLFCEGEEELCFIHYFFSLIKCNLL